MITNLIGKIDISEILRDHFQTLRDAHTKRVSQPDRLLFFVAPLVPVVVLLYFRIDVSNDTIGVLATALSIIAGLLFNLLVLLHTLPSLQRGDPYDSDVARLLRELHANIAYAIVVSLVTLLPLVVATNLGSGSTSRLVFGNVATYLVTHFVLTMCMVLKRMDTMLQIRVRKD